MKEVERLQSVQSRLARKKLRGSQYVVSSEPHLSSSEEDSELGGCAVDHVDHN
jgi:hypothetical protein